MHRTRRFLTVVAFTAIPLMGLAIPAHADVMLGDGHLEGKSTACVGPLFVDGANGGLIASGHVGPHADQWTVRATETSAPAPFVTVVDLTSTDLNQFVSVAEHPTLFPGFFRVCVTNKGAAVDYNAQLDSGPF
jgi:hypothetical protein